MKFSCQKSDIVQAVQTVAKAISPKPQTPILSGIYVLAKDNQVTFEATDNDIGIITTISADIDIPGETVVAGKYFQEILRKMPDERIEFSYNNQENKVVLKAKQARFSFLTMNADDFPVIAKLEGGYSFNINDISLKELIDYTSFACSRDEKKPIFNGCSLELQDEAISMVGTNIFRMSIKQDKMENFTGKQKFIIPAKILSELAKLLQSDLPRSVSVCCCSNKISFECDNFYIFSRLIEGEFPDYHNAMPLDYKTKVTMNTSEISSIIDRLSLISRADEYNVIFMDFANGQVVISTDNPEIGHGEESAPAVINGEDVKLAINADFVNDALKLIKSKEFTMGLNGKLGVVCIRNDADPSFMYIVTPVRR